MKIANIVSKTKINVSQDFNVVDSLDEIIQGIPTLIVGFEYVCGLYPDFDVLEKKIDENIYWTCQRNEKRDKYEEDLEWFITKVYSDLTADISYIFVDPIHYNKKTMLKLIRKIYSTKDKITYQHGKMIYIYGDKFIFGVDLKLLEYIGKDSEKILTKIKSNSSVFLGGYDILIEYKNLINELDGQVRYVPYLYSIKNEQNDITSIFYIPRES
jgi:hypothetical protein